jgi:hypothetical protein
MRQMTLFIFMSCLSAGLSTGCAAQGAATDGRAAQSSTSTVEQRVVGGGGDLCSQWTQCYIGCAAMDCDDDASCAAQQAAYESCDESYAPAPDYCPLPM